MFYIGEEAKIWKKLQRAIKDSEKHLRRFREQRIAGIKDYVGTNYGDIENKAEPLNEMYSAVSILVPMLVTRNPRYRVRSPIMKFRPFAYEYEQAHNHLVKEIDLASTLRRAVTDSLFLEGIVKCGIFAGSQVEVGGFLHDVGQPFCDTIDFDDWREDPCARRHEESYWMGNRYRIPIDAAAEMFPNVDATKLKAQYREYGSGSTGEETTEELSGQKRNLEELVDYIELYDIWLPRENLLVTLAAEGQADEPLKVVQFDGPESGPYDFLGYYDVPNNPIPLAPLQVVRDLHTMVNTMARKMKRQAERAKRVLAYEDTAFEDASRIVNARDGEAVKVDNIERIKEIGYSGASPELFGTMQFLIAMFSKIGGGLDLLGGLSAGARTATEGAILSANQRTRTAYMGNQVYNFTERIGRKLAWYLWNDPLIELPLIKRIPGVGEIEVVFSEDAREGDFWDYNFEIVPYSMQARDPESHVERIMQLVAQVILPTVEAAASQGSLLNVDALVGIVARELDIDEVDELYVPGLRLPTTPQRGIQPYQPPSKQQSGGTIYVGQGNQSARLGSQEQGMMATAGGGTKTEGD